jgi:hypothetical protein
MHFTPLDGAVLIGIWGWALWGYMMRSRNTLALLGAGTVVYAASTLLPPALAAPARAIVIVVVILILLERTDWFIAMRRADRRFEIAYGDAMARLAKLTERKLSGGMAAGDFLSGIEQLAADLERMPAPSDEWSALKTRASAYLRREVELYDALGVGSMPPDEVLAEAGREKDALLELHGRVRRRAYSFWRS